MWSGRGTGGRGEGGSDIICPPPQESAPRLRNIPQLHEIVCDIVRFLENQKKFSSFVHFVCNCPVESIALFVRQ